MQEQGYAGDLKSLVREKEFYCRPDCGRRGKRLQCHLYDQHLSTLFRAKEKPTVGVSRVSV